MEIVIRVPVDVQLGDEIVIDDSSGTLVRVLHDHVALWQAPDEPASEAAETTAP